MSDAAHASAGDSHALRGGAIAVAASSSAGSDSATGEASLPGTAHDLLPGHDPLPALALRQKEQALRQWLAGCPSVLVAFSGGVDSAYLAWVAHDVLGDRALAVTADSPSYPERHRAAALDLARGFALRHEIIHTDEVTQDDYRANPVNRCYYCKRELYTRLRALADDRGVAVIVDGNNADDRTDHRPGRAAAREMDVRSPLDDVDLGKAEIRALARDAGLPCWDAPASACLSSRVPYHSAITEAKLSAIDRAEGLLQDLGFRVCRVRHHDTIARIELGRDEMARALDPAIHARIVDGIKALGFQFVALDLQGYRLGSLNEPIRLRAI